MSDSVINPAHYSGEIEAIEIGPDEEAVQIHPKESEYVHSVGHGADALENVLHIWRPKDGDWTIMNRRES